MNPKEEAELNYLLAKDLDTIRRSAGSISNQDEAITRQIERYLELGVNFGGLEIALRTYNYPIFLISQIIVPNTYIELYDVRFVLNEYAAMAALAKQRIDKQENLIRLAQVSLAAFLEVTDQYTLDTRGLNNIRFN